MIVWTALVLAMLLGWCIALAVQLDGWQALLACWGAVLVALVAAAVAVAAVSSQSDTHGGR